MAKEYSSVTSYLVFGQMFPGQRTPGSLPLTLFLYVNFTILLQSLQSHRHLPEVLWYCKDKCSLRLAHGSYTRKAFRSKPPARMWDFQLLGVNISISVEISVAVSEVPSEVGIFHNLLKSLDYLVIWYWPVSWVDVQ